MHPVNNWARDYPCFELPEGKETPVYSGTFATAHPWRGMFYGVLGKSKVQQYLQIWLPRTPNDYACHLTGCLIKDSMKMFKAKFPNSRFVVLIVPAHRPRVENLNWIQPWLDKYEIPYFVGDEDVASLLPLERRTVDGAHPTPEANEIVARALASWLGKSGDNQGQS